jgi:hypothetical protein
MKGNNIMKKKNLNIVYYDRSIFRRVVLNTIIAIWISISYGCQQNTAIYSSEGVAVKTIEIPSQIINIKTPTEDDIQPSITALPISKTQIATTTSIYYSGNAPSLDLFTRMSEKYLQKIMAEISKTPKLLNHEKGQYPRFRIYSAMPIFSEQWTYASIGCVYNDTCVVRASIRTINPYGGPDLWKYIWELYDGTYDGERSHKYIITYIGGNSEDLHNYEYFGLDTTDIEQVAEINMSRFNALYAVSNRELLLVIETQTNTLRDHMNPYTWDLTNGAGIKEKETLRKLEEGGYVLPEYLSNMTIQAVISQLGG